MRSRLCIYSCNNNVVKYSQISKRPPMDPPLDSQMIFYSTAGRNGTAFSSGSSSPKEPATVSTRRATAVPFSRYRSKGATVVAKLLMVWVSVVSCRPYSPCLLNNPWSDIFTVWYHFSLPNLGSDGESYLVAEDVLVGEKIELPPASRQAFWDL